MKFILSALFILFCFNCLGQVTDTLNRQPVTKTNRVSFITTLDIANATKDGIYLNGYVVNLSHAKAEKLDGKKIKVTGKVRNIKGLKNMPGYDEKKGYWAGREEDWKYIKSPKIKLLE